MQLNDEDEEFTRMNPGFGVRQGKRRHVSADAMVYVVGAYLSAGGAFMAYHVARLLHLEFGYKVTVLTISGESPRGGAFTYDLEFPSVALTEFPSLVRAADILICNPSFSDGLFGMDLDCFKLMYVQGFNTFRVLDLWFDHHVAVGGFVHDFMRSTYGLTTTIIPPFIATEGVEALEWSRRPPASLLVALKGKRESSERLLQALRSRLWAKAPDIDASIDWDGSVLTGGAKRIDHADLLARLGRARHLLTLSTSEGFGLVPLEAMAMGAVVLGLDGYGGRDYMRPGVNCEVRPFPDVDGVVDDLIALVRRPERAAALANAGRETAQMYTFERFRHTWMAELASVLSGGATSQPFSRSMAGDR